MMEKLKLSDRKWSQFTLEKVFDISATSSSIDKKNLTKELGKTPYVTRTDRNNGIDMFIGEQPNYDMDEGNVLTIGLDTQTVFYQPQPFYTGQNIQVLRHGKINRYVAEFLIVPIKKLMVKFNWGGNGATLTRLKRSKIMLPIDSQGNPDWQFMDTYMRQIEQEQIKPIIEALCKRLKDSKLWGG